MEFKEKQADPMMYVIDSDDWDMPCVCRKKDVGDAVQVAVDAYGVGLKTVKIKIAMVHPQGE